MKHRNNGRCQRCLQIINSYPGFHHGLRDWFTALQGLYLPEVHVSEAGRGRARQEQLKKAGASRASYGESAHNYNAALDLFEQGGDSSSNIYEKKWFNEKMKPHLGELVNWYGHPGSSFYELPHVEVKNWKELVTRGDLKLVE